MVDKNLVRERMKNGYTESEANLEKEEFDKVSARKKGSRIVRGYNLAYVCRLVGLKYDTVVHWLDRHPKTDPEEYFSKHGVDLNEYFEV